MRLARVPIAFLLCAMPAVANADSPLKRPLFFQPQRHPQAAASHRMVMPAEVAEPRTSGSLLASLAIAPNAAVGIGKFVTPPRRRVSLQDQPVSLQPKKIKKAAIGLTLHF